MYKITITLKKFQIKTKLKILEKPTTYVPLKIIEKAINKLKNPRHTKGKDTR